MMHFLLAFFCLENLYLLYLHMDFFCLYVFVIVTINRFTIKNTIANHLKALSDFFDSHSSIYKKVLVLGDFNVEVAERQNFLWHLWSSKSYKTVVMLQKSISSHMLWLITHYCASHFWNYMCNRKRAITFPFGDTNCHEKTF